MDYGMEVWGLSDPRGAIVVWLSAPIEAVLQHAVKMAVGVHATAVGRLSITAGCVAQRDAG